MSVRRGVLGHDEVLDPLAQLPGRERAGVDALPDLGEPREHAPLLGDGLGQCLALARERMGPARSRKSAA